MFAPLTERLRHSDIGISGEVATYRSCTMK
jgi:hypothetical protein